MAQYGMACGETDGTNYVTMVPSPVGNRFRTVSLATLSNRDTQDTSLSFSLHDGSNWWEIYKQTIWAAGTLKSDAAPDGGSYVIPQGWKLGVKLNAGIAAYESHWSAHWAEGSVEIRRVGVAAGQTNGAQYVTMISSPPGNRVREVLIATFVNKDTITETHPYVSLYDGTNHYDIRNRELTSTVQNMATPGQGSVIIPEGWSLEVRLDAAATTNESHWSAHWVERDA